MPRFGVLLHIIGPFHTNEETKSVTHGAYTWRFASASSVEAAQELAIMRLRKESEFRGFRPIAPFKEVSVEVSESRPARITNGRIGKSGYIFYFDDDLIDMDPKEWPR